MSETYLSDFAEMQLEVPIIAPSLILLDLMMPVMDGFEFVVELSVRTIEADRD